MTSDDVKLVHGKSSYQDYFVVNWCFFTVCNFSCSYCPTSLHDGKHRGPDINTVKNFCQRIIENKKDKKVFFEFTGGEITYYKNFVELFEFLKQAGAETGLISNGSRDLNFWRQHCHLFDHICLSFHPEEGKKEHFFEVIKLLNQHSTIHVNIMMLPEKFQELHEFAQQISAEVEGVSVSMQALFENMSGGIFHYTPEQKQILDRQELPWGKNILYPRPVHLPRKVYRGEMIRIKADGAQTTVVPPELIARGENKWLGWDCHIGLENIVISPDGSVRRGWCGVGGVIGLVTQPDFKLPEKPIQCSAQSCHCSLDIMATKEKSSRAVS